MRIAIGMLMHESNTFVSTQTGLDDFAAYVLLYDHDIMQHFENAQTELTAFIDVLSTAEATIVPTIAANAMAGGPVTTEAFDHLLAALTERLHAALPLDGVLLALHGAMTTIVHPDAEAVILKSVRDVVGPDVPIAASLDLHGHITPEMLSLADILVGYHEYPHTDMVATGKRAARFLLDTLAEKIQPVMALTKCPLIVSPVQARTANTPLADIIAKKEKQIQQSALLDVAFFPVQPWLDMPDLGFAVLVLADGDSMAAHDTADYLAALVWQSRDEFEPTLSSLEAAIDVGLQSEGITVVGDAGDAPTGGTAADNVHVLQTLIAKGADKAERLTFLTLCDATAAQAAAQAGVGNTISVHVGHSISTQDGSPISISATVLTISDGNYHADSMGITLQLGLTAVLAVGSIRLCVRSLPSMEWDPGMYTSLELNFQEAAIVFVKSPSHFRATFGDVADRILIADTLGATCPNMRKLHFTQVTRPLYPLDEFDWSP